jgi:hypothetical protein
MDEGFYTPAQASIGAVEVHPDGWVHSKYRGPLWRVQLPSARKRNPGPAAHKRSEERQETLFRASGSEYHRGARDAHRGVPAANPKKRADARPYARWSEYDLTSALQDAVLSPADRRAMEAELRQRGVPRVNGRKDLEVSQFLDAVKQGKLRDAYANLEDLVRQGALTPAEANAWRASIEDRILGGDR